MQYTEYRDTLIADCQDSLLYGFRGSLEIHSVIEGECETPTLILINMKISLMVEDHKCCDQYHIYRDQSCAIETVSICTLTSILTD